MLIAHRGLVKEGIKENTLQAFLGAIKSKKYTGFELDVYTSKDGIFVVHHDPLINGKFIWNYNYKELRKKGIIKLNDVLKLNTDKIILIEIKDIHLDIEKFTKLLNKYQNKKLYVMSFFNSVIKKFKNPTFKVGVLNYILNSTSEYHYDFIGILYDVATTHMINSLKDLNIEVFLYALNKKDKYLFKDVYYIVDD
ncbi:glycerophosphoryl diester phosphodiesterase [Mycoplasma sp. CAG:776]|nr:glycerophosphoryl diester phosphodiesterase [Mycoplasma sp. CAG:776]